MDYEKLEQKLSFVLLMREQKRLSEKLQRINEINGKMNNVISKIGVDRASEGGSGRNGNAMQLYRDTYNNGRS